MKLNQNSHPLGAGDEMESVLKLESISAAH